MDPVVQVLMQLYGLSEPQAIAYAGTLKKGTEDITSTAAYVAKRDMILAGTAEKAAGKDRLLSQKEIQMPAESARREPGYSSMSPERYMQMQALSKGIGAQFKMQQDAEALGSGGTPAQYWDAMREYGGTKELQMPAQEARSYKSENQGPTDGPGGKRGTLY